MTDAGDIYQLTTDRILAQLERDEGLGTWSQLWITTGGNGIPANAVTGRLYNGVNVLIFGAPPRPKASAVASGRRRYAETLTAEDRDAVTRALKVFTGRCGGTARA